MDFLMGYEYGESISRRRRFWSTDPARDAEHAWETEEFTPPSAEKDSVNLQPKSQHLARRRPGMPRMKLVWPAKIQHEGQSLGDLSTRTGGKTERTIEYHIKSKEQE